MTPGLFALYLVSLAGIALMVVTVRRFCRIHRLPSTVSLCVQSATLLYLSCLIPGALDRLTPLAVTVTLLLLAVGLVAMALPLSRPLEAAAPTTAVSPRPDASWIGLPTALAALGLLATTPLPLYFLRLPSAIFDSQMKIGWDTVSYHLPALVDYLQHRSLHSVEVPYQAYSFGFELIGGFPAVFFRSHWSVIVASGYAVAFLLSVLWLLVGQLLKALRRHDAAHHTLSFSIAVALWALAFPLEILDIGKNDIFQAACLLSYLCLLIELLQSADASRRYATLALASAALLLALATKPTAIPYAVLLPVVLGPLYVPAPPDSRWSGRGRLISLVIALVVVAGLGGFFDLRDLFAFGTVAPGMSGAEKLSLAANLTNRAVYRLEFGSVAMLVATLTPLLVVFRRKQLLGSDPSRARVLILVWLFFLVSLGTFAVTPHAIFHDSLEHAAWKLRLGMPLFSLTAVVLAVGLARVATLTGLFAPRPLKSGGAMPAMAGVAAARSRDVMLAFVVLVGGVTVPAYWSRHPTVGLPGYETIKGLPSTDVYRRIQHVSRPLRIYSAGLRPYGLYGSRWQHVLFYDLHSTELSPDRVGKVRLATIVVDFKPDIILISVDPHFYTASLEQPLVGWIKSETGCFQEIFSDAAVSGFRLKPGCMDTMRALVPPGYRTHMGG